MVTRTFLRRHTRRRAAPLASALAVLALALCSEPRPAAAQAPPELRPALPEKTLIFFTAKTGEQTAGGGDLFDTLAANHGPLQDSRSVTRNGFDLDIYAVTPHKYGVAVGIELMDYDKTFHFSNPTGAQTPERLRLEARSFLFMFKGFLRFGDFLPFVGAGTGTYYVSYNEEVSGLSFLDASTNILSYRAGFRWLMVGRLGLLVETGTIYAPIHVTSNNTTSTLNLGGDFTNVGLSYVW